MRAQIKNLNPRIALPVLSVLASLSLTACASNGDARRDVPHWQWQSHDQQGHAQLMTHSGNSGAVIFAPGSESNPSFYAYERDLTPEYDRRDTALALSEPDPTAGWYAWPQAQRPTLDDRESFYTSSNPNVYTYPGDGVRRSYRYHSRGHHHSRDYPRRRVR